MKEKSLPVLPLLKRLLKVSRQANLWLLLACLIVIAASIVSIFFAHTLGRAIDTATAAGSSINTFWPVMLLLSILAFLFAPFAFATTWLSGRFAENALAHLRSLIAVKTAYLPIRFLETNHSGQLMTIMSSDLTKIKTLLTANITGVLEQTALVIASLIYMINTNWQLTLVTLVLTPLLFLLMSAVTNPLTRQTAKMQEAVAEVNSLAQDGLSGQVVAKSFNLQNILAKTFAHKTTDVVSKANKIAKTNAAVIGVSFAAQIAPFIILFGFGGYQVISGSMSAGEFFAFIQLMNNFSNSLGLLPDYFASIKEAAGSAARIFELLDQEEEPKGGMVAAPPMGYEPAVLFNNVSFRYDDDKDILKNVSFAVQPGETVAIVGPSGSGKSTLLKLLLGFYPVTDGSISVMGHDLKEWNIEALRSNMAFVAQDTYLIPVSIAANIACGREDEQEQIEKAARMANMETAIQSFSDGYQTEVGERGARLSGGQRQRIAIARAVLKSAPVLLLDEATSALDNESELLVQEALERMMAGRTTLVVAHRLSTIKNADRIIVINEGQIVEQGAHEDLLARHGLYEKLFLRQFQVDQADGGQKANGLNSSGGEPVKDGGNRPGGERIA